MKSRGPSPLRGRGIRYSEPRYVRAAKGLPLTCRAHGEHTDWEVNKSRPNDVTCKRCRNESAKRYQRRHPIKTLLSRVRRWDKDCELTEEFLNNLIEKQQWKCALTGIPLGDIHKPSIDRIDSSRGYKLDNVQFTIYPVNRMKSNLPLQEFIQLCCEIAQQSEPEYGVGGC